MPGRTWRWARGMLLIAALAAAAPSGGCVAVGVIAHKLFGPPATPARYNLPDAPTLVLVESYKNPTGTFVVSEQLARAVVDDLRTSDRPPTIVPLDELFRLRDADPARFAKMTVGEVAGALGAKQVIYVDVRQSTIEPVAGGELLRGSMLVRVKVVDDAGKMLWPDSGEGYPVGIETPTVQTGKGVNASTLQDSMAETVGLSVGRLFHKWKVE